MTTVIVADAFSLFIGELCERSPKFGAALSKAADEVAHSLQAYLERLRHIKNARSLPERLIWSLLNRLSSLQPTKHPAGIKRAGKRTREKSLIETLLETQPITISQEVTM